MMKSKKLFRAQLLLLLVGTVLAQPTFAMNGKEEEDENHTVPTFQTAPSAPTPSIPSQENKENGKGTKRKKTEGNRKPSEEKEEVEEPRPSKKHENDSVPLFNLPPNVLLHITSFLRAPDLGALAQICETGKSISYNAEMWRELAQKSGLCCEEYRYARDIFLSAVGMDHIPAQKAFADFLSDGKFIKVNGRKAYNLYKDIEENSKSPTNLKLEVQLRKVQLYLDNYLQKRSPTLDLQVSQNLEKIGQQAEAKPAHKAKVKLMAGRMRYEQQPDPNRDNQTFQLLTAVSQNTRPAAKV